jgi:hypothetical protein
MIGEKRTGCKSTITITYCSFYHFSLIICEIYYNQAKQRLKVKEVNLLQIKDLEI